MLGGRRDSKYPEKMLGGRRDSKYPDKGLGGVDSRKRNWDLYKKIRDRIPPIIIPPIIIPPMIVAAPAVREMFNKLEYNPIVNNQ